MHHDRSWLFAAAVAAGLALWAGSASGVELPTSLSLSPASLTFNAVEGGSDPVDQAVAVTNSAGGTLDIVTTSVIYDLGSGWLTVIQSGAGNSQSLTNSVSVTGLIAGTYTATVDVICANAPNSPQTYTVAFAVGAPAPTVTGVNPDNGPEVGGTAVTLTGASFVDGATVTFGGNPATDVTFVNATQITCTTPVGTGTVDVAVSNPDSQGGALVAGFTYGVSPSIEISPTFGLVTTEAGGTASFQVVLTTTPSADVTVELSSSNTAEGELQGAVGNVLTLTFTPSDWDTAQWVTVVGVDDAVFDGDVAYAISTAPASSADTGYSGFDPADVSVTNADDEVVRPDPVTDFVAAPVNEERIELSWTNPTSGGLAGVVVFRGAGAAPTFIPMDGAAYASGNTYGDADCIYAGTGESFSDAGLAADTSYFYVAYTISDTDVYSSATSFGASTTAVTPPTVLWTSPEDGSADALLATVVQIAFSEPMVRAATETAFSIDGGVAGEFSWSGNTLSFTPSDLLAEETTYTVTIGGGAIDEAGNALSPVTVQFTSRVPIGGVLGRGCAPLAAGASPLVVVPAFLLCLSARRRRR